MVDERKMTVNVTGTGKRNMEPKRMEKEKIKEIKMKFKEIAPAEGVKLKSYDKLTTDELHYRILQNNDQLSRMSLRFQELKIGKQSDNKHELLDSMLKQLIDEIEMYTKVRDRIRKNNREMKDEIRSLKRKKSKLDIYEKYVEKKTEFLKVIFPEKLKSLNEAEAMLEELIVSSERKWKTLNEEYEKVKKENEVFDEFQAELAQLGKKSAEMDEEDRLITKEIDELTLQAEKKVDNNNLEEEISRYEAILESAEQQEKEEASKSSSENFKNPNDFPKLLKFFNRVQKNKVNDTKQKSSSKRKHNDKEDPMSKSSETQKERHTELSKKYRNINPENVCDTNRSISNAKKSKVCFIDSQKPKQKVSKRKHNDVESPLQKSSQAKKERHTVANVKEHSSKDSFNDLLPIYPKRVNELRQVDSCSNTNIKEPLETLSKLDKPSTSRKSPCDENEYSVSTEGDEHIIQESKRKKTGATVKEQQLKNKNIENTQEVKTTDGKKVKRNQKRSKPTARDLDLQSDMILKSLAFLNEKATTFSKEPALVENTMSTELISEKNVTAQDLSTSVEPAGTNSKKDEKTQQEIQNNINEPVTEVGAEENGDKIGEDVSAGDVANNTDDLFDLDSTNSFRNDCSSPTNNSLFNSSFEDQTGEFNQEANEGDGAFDFFKNGADATKGDDFFGNISFGKDDGDGGDFF